MAVRIPTSVQAFRTESRVRHGDPIMPPEATRTAGPPPAGPPAVIDVIHQI